MPRLAANLSMMFNEHDFLDRFAAARKCGFEAVEFLFPYAFPKQEIAARLAGAGLQQVLFNTAQGDWEKGDRGIGAVPGREAEGDAEGAFLLTILTGADLAGDPIDAVDAVEVGLGGRHEIELAGRRRRRHGGQQGERRESGLADGRGHDRALRMLRRPRAVRRL